MKKFIFDNTNNLKYFQNTDDISQNLINIPEFSLDNGCLLALQNNHRDEYKNIAKKYIQRESFFDIKTYQNDYIILDNSLVNSNGVIMTNNQIFLNGGCLCNINNSFEGNIQRHDNVISISAMWSDGIWHFPFESLVALKVVSKDIIDKCNIHVSRINKYIIQWFELINIPSSKLISGNVNAKKLYIPRMGKCGHPYFSQIKWLQQIVHRHLINDDKFQYIILIKRNKKRPLKNHIQLEELLNFFCKRFNLKLYIHDDNNLPPLKQQQKIFNRAKYVFAPHGAGGIHLVSMREGSWFIEILSGNPIRVNSSISSDINICYSRLSYLCSINYKGILMNSDSTIDLKKIEKVLKDLSENNDLII